MMGASGHTDIEKPVHRVTVAAFAIGRYEVTQGQWKAVMGNNPSMSTECGDDCPVEQVSYDNIQGYIARLNRLTAGRYRLPTEAEWEYACRAGGNHEYCGSDDADEVGWYIGNSGIRTHIVGIKQANTFGLYDMSGNVMEWTCSAYTKNGNGYDGSEKLCTDDARVESVIRGGSWFSARALLRSANSTWGLRDFGHFNLGFRLAHDY